MVIVGRGVLGYSLYFLRLMRPMKIASSVSIASDSRMAAEEAATEVAAALDGAAVDLAFLFISSHHTSHAEEIGEIIREKVPAEHFVGCTA